MTGVARITKLDFFIMKSQGISYLSLVAVILLFGLMGSSITVLCITGAWFIALMATNIFAIQEKNHLDRLYGSVYLFVFPGPVLTIEFDEPGACLTIFISWHIHHLLLFICKSRCLSRYNFCTCLCLNLLTCCLSCITHTINAFFKIFSAYFSTDYNVALLFKFTVNLSHKLVCC